MKAVFFGEIMLRLSPEGPLRFLQENSFRSYFGGSEANTAIALSQMGTASSFVTKLPCNDIASACLRELSSFGVDVSSVSRGGRRMGIYFCENGTSVRAGKVIYDREGSAISEALPDDFDIERIFEGASLFHFTGITPALSDRAAILTKLFAGKAHEKGLKVSCDLNYRSTLWPKERARRVMKDLMPFTDILMANEGSVLDVFGISAENDGALAEILTKEFSFECVALTKRKSENADTNTLSGLIYKDGKAFSSPEITVNITDRVGGGDAFNAGIIYGILNNLSPEETVNYANAMNALKHTMKGDYAVFSPEEVKQAASGCLDGRIRR